MIKATESFFCKQSRVPDLAGEKHVLVFLIVFCLRLRVQGNNKHHFPILDDRTKALPRMGKMEKEVAALQKKWQPLARGFFLSTAAGAAVLHPRQTQYPKTPPSTEPQFNQFSKPPMGPRPVRWLLQSQELGFIKPPNSKEKLRGRKNQEGESPQGSKVRSSDSHRLSSSFSSCSGSLSLFKTPSSVSSS